MDGTLFMRLCFIDVRIFLFLMPAFVSPHGMVLPTLDVAYAVYMKDYEG